MSDALYRKDLLRLAADATGAGRLPNADRTGVAFNPACGDRVTFDLTLANDTVVAVAHETRACVLTQASASILGRALEGKTRREIGLARDAVSAMLEGRATVPDAPFDGYAAFEGALAHPARHRCVLLPFEAVLAALSDGKEG